MPRHPHLGHTALFALLTVCVLLPATAIILTLHLPQLLLLAATYCLTLTLAALLFPFIWNQPLSTGLHWNPSAIKPRLFLLGPALAVLTQAIESLLPTPKDLPIDQILRTTPSLILLALFGTFLAPLFEEVLFRGFLPPVPGPCRRLPPPPKIPRVPGKVARPNHLFSHRHHPLHPDHQHSLRPPPRLPARLLLARRHPHPRRLRRPLRRPTSEPIPSLPPFSSTPPTTPPSSSPSPSPPTVPSVPPCYGKPDSPKRAHP